jgi:hypothetical protein
MSSQDNETGRLASNISSPKFRLLGSTKASKCVREMKDADAGMAWGSWTPHSVQTIKTATKTRLQGSRVDSCGTHQVRDSYKNIVWSPANYTQSYGRITSGSAELTIMAGGSSRQCMRGLLAYPLKHDILKRPYYYQQCAKVRRRLRMRAIHPSSRCIHTSRAHKTEASHTSNSDNTKSQKE